MRDEGDVTPIGITLWETTRRMTRAFDAVLAEHGGNRPVWFVFLALAEGGHQTQRELAREIGIKESTLTHHLNALERRGLVARRRDPDDRRVQLIEFTPEGRRVFEGMRTAAIAHDRRIQSALGPDGVRALRKQLVALADAVGERGEADGLPPLDPI
ncbi:MarR family winged helix-turn-helix transcriptional regulator [Spongisporangium articulatum]|uniref:MarR family winged helix-turn-helix transcriptional regulator n=1 Tax=Spongisporangium articulatum TaxID=3362603 RepID=A0ABW8AU91_9ACTN